LQSLSIGLILNNNVKERRQRFEMDYTNSVKRQKMMIFDYFGKCHTFAEELIINKIKK